MLTLASSFEEIKAEFPEFYLRSKVEELKSNFRRFDLNQDGSLDFEEVKGMMEKLGQPKTHLQLKDMIAEVDTSNSGSISFHDFLRVLHPKKEAGKEAPALTLFGRIYQTSLAGKAKHFEEQMAQVRGKTKEELEAEVKAEAAQRREERRREKEAQAERERERLAAEEKAKSKANFAAKFAAFQQ
ncbi:apoptosis-inducing factor [Balamuthia mandrillaris]